MAATPRYVVSSDNENYAESSPDPLAESFNEDRVRAVRPLTATRAPKQQPLTSSSPSKQNRKSNVADLDLLSPTKQMLLSTPRTGGQSPWRIKVTVQAEPGSDSENLESPIVKHVTTTKTTKVPLKDADASSPVKRRGRPRKPDAAAKRSGTPVRKRASSRAHRSSVGDTSAADIDTDGTPRRRRGRPRKIQPPAEDDIWGQARQSSVGADASAADVETDATPKKRRGRPRKSIQPPVEDEPTPLVEEVALGSPPAPDGVETDTPADAPLETDVEEGVPRVLPQVSSPTRQERRTRLNTTPTQTETSRKLKARKNTPVAKDAILIEISSDEESQQQSDVDGEPSIFQRRQQHPTEDAADDSDDFEPVQVPTIAADHVDGEQHDETHFALDEGATRMPDDTTIIDSENFSMISVDSLPSCASVTRLGNCPTRNTPNADNRISLRNHDHLNMPSINSRKGEKPMVGARSSPTPSHITLPLPQDPQSAPPRYKTPSVEPVELSIPPPVESARPDPTEAQTPRIGRVVKAGVALQGVLDPNRVTPEAGPSKTVEERREDLDDLFRGFSERTRRELHAGLRLGEQLAKQNHSNQPSSPAPSSPIKTMNPGLSAGNHAAPDDVPQQHRLLTPEDQDDDVAPAGQATEVEYPTLPHSDRSGLLSPVSNPEDDEDEMSWRIDTPPVHAANQHVDQATDVRAPSASVGRGATNIWEEEATRSSALHEDNNAGTGETPRIQALFAQDGPVKPARGKLPRTWRRKTADDFQYSDEAEESQVVTPPSTEADEPVESSAQQVDKSKDKIVPSSGPEENDEESDASDDTGMFFQANMPNLFNKKRSGELRRKRAQNSDISLHLDESLLPESSPPVGTRTPAMDKTNPFLNAPPQLAALRSSPTKSSPLRRELRSSDISSESAHQTFEESTLPLAPSSPFHTFVEGDTGRSMASDQRQFMYEMAGTDSSLRRIRDEADEYLDAYEPQERELEDLTEVTEPSRTWNKDRTVLASSPPKQTLEESILRPTRTFAPLFGDGNLAQYPLSAQQTPVHCAPKPASSNTPNKAPTPVTSRIGNKELARPPTSASTVTPSTSSPLMRQATAPPPAHPALKKLDPLPRIEPWTKTHYKALDKLYQMYKKQPVIFSPADAPNAALNTTLLTNFLNSTTRNFIGARYRAWGYNVIFTDALIVLAAAYMQLLTLDSVEEYEERAGKEIQMGDCAPGRNGEAIGAENVAERLATIVLGEAVRRDEKRGKRVDKSGRLRVEWPE